MDSNEPSKNENENENPPSGTPDEADPDSSEEQSSSEQEDGTVTETKRESDDRDARDEAAGGSGETDQPTDEEVSIEGRTFGEVVLDVIRAGRLWIQFRSSQLWLWFWRRRWARQRRERIRRLGEKAIETNPPALPPDLKDEFEELNETDSKLEEKIRKREEELQEIRTEIQEKRTERDERLREVEEEQKPVREKARLNNVSLEKAEKKKKEYQEKLDDVKTRLEQRRNEQGDSGQMAPAAEGAMGGGQNPLDRVDDLEEEKRDCETALEEAEEELEELRSRREELREKLRSFRDQRKALKAEFREELRTLRSRKGKIERGVYGLEQEVDQIDQEKRSYASAIGEFLLGEDLDPPLLTYKKRVKRDDRKLQDLEQRREELHERVRKLSLLEELAFFGGIAAFIALVTSLLVWTLG